MTEGALVVEPRGGSGAMFDRIASRYDMLNRVLSLGVDQSWRRRTVRSLGLDAKPEATVLDLATGTADLAVMIARTHPSATVVGIDPSRGMLAVGETKVSAAGLAGRVTLRVGEAESLPVGDRSVDGITMAFGIRNVVDRPRALREMARVTKLDGRIAILELSEPERGVMAVMARFHIRVLVPRLGALLSGAREYRYLQESIAAFPSASRFAEMMSEAGIEVLEKVPLTFGVAHLYVGRPRP